MNICMCVPLCIMDVIMYACLYRRIETQINKKGDLEYVYSCQVATLNFF